ncbi:DNA repair protein RAD50 isoform X2 [Cynara cardunculus var. scolymus]|uniref:DNA repair protein RAD50 isoform X2 n=1 Tax=Cynara cardunculus var. scolymus TaxID=59895 RepID=UPI000D62DAA5|nr:DNA repair protein RAD50 isoform X2 [Cynara cardunculus var. scolymus]
MSTVDKMLIKGIRSFDPENRNVITFYKPLTLIVGANGAGKTTIIECLKLSCTGELPPNARSGQSFIHDPKVAGETETKAQIKLRFKTAAGKEVVCIRSFQLTQKASKMEYKAIESVLQTINPHSGEKVCLSYRCADMDREIPALMGVSKAILENVIFVHQDEANWPLQDSSTLKKKFDDIFSATRYTKALEIIKKLHKDQAQEIKLSQKDLEKLQLLKDAAYKLRQSISQDQEESERLGGKMQELEQNVQDVDTKIRQTEAALKELRKLHDQVATKTAERSTLFQEQEKRYRDLEEENDDLREWNAKFSERIAVLEDKINKSKREVEDIETKSSLSQQQINDYIGKVSKLQAEAESYMSLKKERDMTIQELYKQHNLGSLPNAPFSNEVASNHISRINSRLKDLDRDLDEKKKSMDEELKVAWDLYSDSSDRCKNVEAQKRAKSEIKRGKTERKKEKENERDELELEISGDNVRQIDQKERSLSIEVERLSKQLAEGEFDTKIQAKSTEVETLANKIKALGREKDIMAEDSEERILLSIKKEELESHKKKHKKIIDEYKSKIRGVLKGRLPLDKDLKKEVTQALRALTIEYDDLNSKSREADKDVNAMQLKIQEVNNNLAKHHKDKDSRRRVIESKLQTLDQQSGSIELYIKVLGVAKEKRDVHKSKYNIADGMRQMFDPFERVARAHHICPCCERPFSAEEEDEFVKKQRVKASSSAERMKSLAVESSEAESNFQQLEKLHLMYEEYNKICKETIPLAEKNLIELKAELEQKTQALDDVLGVLAQISSDKELVESLVQPVETCDRLLGEMQKLQQVVDDLEYRLDFRGVGVKSMEEMQRELHTAQNTKENLERELEKFREERREVELDLQRASSRWLTEREKKVKVENALKNLKKVEDELDQLAEEMNQLDIEMKHLDEDVGLLSKEVEKYKSAHENMKNKHNEEYEERAELKRKYHQGVDMLNKLISKIEWYEKENILEKLKDLEEKQSLEKSKLISNNNKKQELLAEVNKTADVVRNQDKLRRDIEDNLRYREIKAKVDGCTLEIESLEERILGMGGISASEADLGKLSKERERLLSELNKYHGTVSVYQRAISKNKIDLKNPEYKEIDKRYFDQLLKLKTTEMANKDLNKYYNALDKALMRFHSMKMEEINKIIRELWQQTYRGQDIDYISIHSDAEGGGTRSYSYKVVMQTGDAELEMRGRCSAGQKVLASLIIRLALAETFCLNCGILALDEPTTNLDVPNAESLAAALLRIMEDRKGQENFQLIVITHDERFAQLIGQRQHAEKYYRVAKDDHQHSIIEAQEIFD